MRRMFEAYGQPSRAFGIGELRDMASQVAGRDLGAFFGCFALGTEALPIEAALTELGLKTTHSGSIRPIPRPRHDRAARLAAILGSKP